MHSCVSKKKLLEQILCVLLQSIFQSEIKRSVILRQTETILQRKMIKGTCKVE